MKNITIYAIFIASLFSFFIGSAQENSIYQEKVEQLTRQKEEVTKQEKEALKKEIEEISTQIENEEISKKEGQDLKEAAAKRRALNIENRLAILDNRIALLNRNEDDQITLDNGSRLIFSVGGEDEESDRLFGFKFEDHRPNKKPKYDRRTYSDIVMAIGINNAIIDGQSLEDTPYKVGGSRFFELGWAWRTRVFKNSNFLRLNYGASFQFNGLKPKDNQYFVMNNGEAELQEFDYDLRKSKLRMDNLVFPVHLEFGPSKKRVTERTIRYSLNNQFRIGIGGYGGFNLGTRQKLKYTRDGEKVKDKLKRDYNTSDFIYGLSAYMGFDGVLLYAKYDLNPIFQNATVDQHNISLGLRFDM